MVNKVKIAKSLENEILEINIELQKIQSTRDKTHAGLKLEIQNSSTKTATEVKKIKSKLKKLDYQKFEKFIEAILLVRNAGNKKNGYKKHHFITEMETYLKIREEFER